MSSYVLAIRVDGSDHGDLVCFLDDDGGAYLVVKEVAEGNPHYHAVLHTRRKPQAIRVALKRSIPGLNGNGAYSVAEVRDLAKYQRYCMKGDSAGEMAEVVGAYGMMYGDVTWQDEMHAAYWHENDALRAARASGNVMDAVFAACKDAGVSWDNRERIAELYIRELVSREKSINLFSIRSGINLLQVKLCPDDRAITDLAAHCCNY